MKKVFSQFPVMLLLLLLLLLFPGCLHWLLGTLLNNIALRIHLALQVICDNVLHIYNTLVKTTPDLLNN